MLVVTCAEQDFSAAQSVYAETRAQTKKGTKERKMVADYKETASTSQPNAMDTMRPMAGGCEWECGVEFGWWV